MNKQKSNRKKYIINKLLYILLMAFILFLPLTCTSKLAKHYLYDLNYQNILMKFDWEFDRCILQSGKKWEPSEKPDSKCSCKKIIFKNINTEHNRFDKVTNDGYLYFESELVGKIVLINKPSFFNEESWRLGTGGGNLAIIDLKTKDICYYY